MPDHYYVELLSLIVPTSNNTKATSTLTNMSKSDTGALRDVLGTLCLSYHSDRLS